MGLSSLRRYHGAPKVAPAPEVAAVEPPKSSATADEWRDYAASRGWDATLSKAKIQDLAKAEAEAKTDAGDERQGPNGPEIVPAGVVTASEPEQGGGEGDNREPGKVGEGVTTSADLTGKAPEPSDGEPATPESTD